MLLSFIYLFKNYKLYFYSPEGDDKIVLNI
jgi:hypothetical protein